MGAVDGPGSISLTWLATAINEGVLDCSGLEPNDLSRAAALAFIVPSRSVQLGVAGLTDFLNRVEPCSSFRPHCISRVSDELKDMSQLIERGFNRPVVLHNAQKDVPRMLETALGELAPSEVIAFSMSAFPFAGSAAKGPSETILALESWLVAQGISPGRGVVLHYRMGLLPDNWSAGLSQQAREIGARSLQQAHWNNYWVQLWQVAKADAAGGSCEGSVCDDRVNKWCATQEEEVSPRTVSQQGNKSFLLLGGDSHYYRARAMQKLFAAGLLNNALWSLALPEQCRYPNDEWRAFCSILPKKLDIDLHGDDDDTPKDITFASDSLYRTTRFSIVLESVIDLQEDFLTEKVLKPIYRTHPFIVACVSSRVLEILRGFGFRTFFPLWKRPSTSAQPRTLTTTSLTHA